MSEKSRFEATLDVDVSADQAWRGLEDIAYWLPNLPTVQSVEPDTREPGGTMRLEPGFRYLVRTSEGPAMQCEVTRADRDLGILQIAAAVGPLRSNLTCSVQATGVNTCTLMRRQSYPGPVGRIFTLLLGRREQTETTDYLRAWADYVKNQR